MESPHNYENSQHETTVFACPGATSFEVEFDERCETEKRSLCTATPSLTSVWGNLVTASHSAFPLDPHRYDYLEFTDSRGGKVRYDMKVGSEKWPKVSEPKPSNYPNGKLLSLHPATCLSLRSYRR